MIQWFFSIFTELCNYHHNQFENLFITPHPQEPSKFSSSHFPFPATFQLYATTGLFILNISFNEIKLYVGFYFCDWALAFSMFSKFILIAAFITTSFLFYCWIIFHWVNIPHFIYLFIRHLFPLFGCYEYAAMGMLYIFLL